MLRPNSQHEQQTYRIIAIACGAVFTLGLLWVLLGFNDQAPPEDNQWQSTRIMVTGDPNEQFSLLSGQPRWYAEPNKRGTKSRIKEW